MHAYKSRIVQVLVKKEASTCAREVARERYSLLPIKQGMEEIGMHIYLDTGNSFFGKMHKGTHSYTY